MTKLTIKIDENITLTGTIVPRDDISDYSGYGSNGMMEVITGNCSMYSGNVKLPMPGMQANPVYRIQRDFDLMGNLVVDGNITSTGVIHGIGSTAHIKKLDGVPSSSTTWAGQPGELAIAGAYIYLCVDTDTWVRWPIATSW